MGSLFSGIVLAYLTIMFLVSIYLSYMATPESVSSYLFMEPRFLVIATGFFGFGVAQMVASSFSSCADPAAAIAGFAGFAFAACWFDLVSHFCTSSGSKIRAFAKWIGLQILAIVPVFFILSGDVPNTIRAACGVLCASATVSNAVDFIFTAWNPLHALSLFMGGSEEESSSGADVQPPDGANPLKTVSNIERGSAAPQWIIGTPLASPHLQHDVIKPIGYASSSPSLDGDGEYGGIISASGVGRGGSRLKKHFA